MPFSISEIPLENANNRNMIIFTYRLLELKEEIIRVIAAKKLEIKIGRRIMAKKTRGLTESSPVKINLKISSRIPGTKVKSSR